MSTIDESTLDERIRGYNWEMAFQCCGPAEPSDCGYSSAHNEPAVGAALGEECDASPFTRSDVKRVIATSDGENDGPNWLGLFQLKDGRYAFLSAGCDYTGWDCRSGGSAVVGRKLGNLVRAGISPEERDRLGIDDKGRPKGTP